MKRLIILILLIANPLLSSDKLDIKLLTEVVSIDSIQKHLQVLGHDSLQGRGTGTVGEQKAATYIADRLKKYRVQPAAKNRSYFQQIPMHGSLPLKSSNLTLFYRDTTVNLELYQDYLLYKTGAQTYIPQPAPLVFVGYGIIAPEFDYNDYYSVDVEGKIAVFLSGEPFSNDPDYFNGSEPSIYSYPESKQRIAISQGAIGSILIPSPLEEQAKPWSWWQNTFSFEHISLAYSTSSNFSIVMNPKTAELLFERSMFKLYEVYEMDHSNTIYSFPLSTDISFRGKFKQRDFLAPNVIGLLKGKNYRKRKNTAVVISAHYDHLGIGPEMNGDSIYNGVIDNAIGTAAVLEIARILSAINYQFENTAIFLFTTGEEHGLLGSTFYIDHPIFPLYKTKVNINIDGLSIIDTFNDIIGIGNELSTVDETLIQTANEFDLKISSLPAIFIASESFARSDQITFAKAGIPSVLIAGGLDFRNISANKGLYEYIQWGRQVYHTPFDDLSQPINYKAVQQHCQINLGLIYSLLVDDKKIEWNEGSPFINARLRSIAEKR